VRPLEEECVQGVVEFVFGFQVGKMACAVDHEQFGALKAGDNLCGHRAVRPGIF
jgi:hypothetical protein